MHEIGSQIVSQSYNAFPAFKSSRIPCDCGFCPDFLCFYTEDTFRKTLPKNHYNLQFHPVEPTRETGLFLDSAAAAAAGSQARIGGGGGEGNVLKQHSEAEEVEEESSVKKTRI